MPALHNRPLRITAALVLLFAALLRVRQYLAVRPLWLDEAMLALNIGTRSFAGLAGRLDHDQAAPLIFLWGEKLAVMVGGMHELSVRFLPLVCGVLAVVFVLQVSRRVLSGWATLLAALWFSVQALPLFYSNEMKPYMGGTAIAIGLTLLTLRLVEKPTAGRWWAFALVGVGDPLLSLKAPLELVRVSAALVVAPGKWRDRLFRRRLILFASAWLVVAGATYVWLMAPVRANEYFHDSLLGSFLSVRSVPAAMASLKIVALFLAGFVLPPDTFPAFWWLAALCVAGAGAVGVAGWLARGQLFEAVLFASPIVAAMGVAFLGLYPFLPRLVMWTAPSLTIMAVRGIEEVAAWLPRPLRVAVATAGAVLILALPGRQAWQHSAQVLRREDVPTLLSDWRAHGRPGQPIYVAARAVPSWAYYTTDWRAPDRARLAWIASINQSGGVAFRNAASRRHPVRHEGWDLARVEDGHTVLYGVPSGMQITPAGLTSPQPDSGWADNEVERIAETGRDTVWLLWAHNLRLEIDSLRGSLQRHGARQIHTQHTPGADLDGWVMAPEASDHLR